MQSGRVPGFQVLAERGRFAPLTSVFPSTTAAALSSFHTGLPPAGHGIAGYRMYMPDRGYVANMIRLSPEADERFGRMLPNSTDARALLGVPTVHSLLTAAGVSSRCLIHRSLAHSGLSEMLYDGATGRGPVRERVRHVQPGSEHADRGPGSDRRVSGCIRTRWTRFSTSTAPGAKNPRERSTAWATRSKGNCFRHSKGSEVSATFMLLADHGHIQVDEKDIVLAAEATGA